MDELQRFWQLTDLPFSATAQPKEAYLSIHNQNVFTELTTASHRFGSINLINGEAGSGKSLLARLLHDKLAGPQRQVFLISMLQKEHKPGWLIPKLADVFGISAQERSIEKFLKKLDQMFFAANKVYFIIDQADWIQTPEALDEVVGLNNLQSIVGPCFTFNLFGSSMMNHAVHQVGSLAKRVFLKQELLHLPKEEVTKFLEHHLKICGTEEPIFSTTAVKAIFDLTRGNFLDLQNLCLGAMKEAFAAKSKAVKKTHVDEAYAKSAFATNKSAPTAQVEQTKNTSNVLDDFLANSTKKDRNAS